MKIWFRYTHESTFSCKKASSSRAEPCSSTAPHFILQATTDVHQDQNDIKPKKKFGEIKTKDRRVQARGLMGRISKISKTINYGNLYGAAAAVRNRVYGQKKRRKKRLETGTRVLEKIAINYSVKCWPFKRFFFRVGIPSFQKPEARKNSKCLF